MSFLSMMEARMPPGFRFHPRDDELVLDYLLHKLSGHDRGDVAIVDVDLKKCEPWELPEAACVGAKEWYFFSLRDRKYATGQRANRATRSGYWKATGKDRTVGGSEATPMVGMRKTLVFYQGRAPKGRKTEWVMHEFRLVAPPPAPWPGHRELPAAATHRHQFKEDWVLCRVFYKGRTTTRPPPSEEADAEPDLSPVARGSDTYTAAFDSSPTATEPVSSFAAAAAAPLEGPVSLMGDLLAFDASEAAIRTGLSSLSCSSSAGLLELPPNWGQENGLVQIWNHSEY